MKNPIVHFEIPADDKERAQKFYKETFGWDFAEMFGYTTVMTCETGEDNKPLEKGEINGGMISKDEAKNPLLVITVPDLEKKIEELKAAGCETTMETKKWGDFGLYTKFIDTEGNEIGLWQDLK